MTENGLCAKLEEALGQFDFSGTPVSCERYGSGHINDTFLVISEDAGVFRKFILQRINHDIFNDPPGLMKNIVRVTAYLRKKILEQGGDPERETLNVVPARDGLDYYRDSIGSFWRVYLFIDDAVSYDQVEQPEDFYESGKAFGNFQGLLADFPAQDLMETIKDFHNTPVRIENFEKAVSADICGRVRLVEPEIAFIRERAKELGRAMEMLRCDMLPLRVTHNDTKLNNIMIDKRSRRGICVIDLDTIMPGLSIHDFGDAIRFGANTALEDEQDLSRVSLSLPLFETYTKGFLEGTGGRLTEPEVRMLPMGAKIMTMECGIRFLTDYLEGDVYFKIHKEHHNLDRARNQLALTKDMEMKWEQMEAIVGKYWDGGFAND